MSANSPSKKTFLLVWIVLMLLLFMTCGLARLDLGAANTPVALLIAGIKMLLVLLIFMQVRWQSRSVWIFAMAGFFWFLLWVTLTMSDYLTRGQIAPTSPMVSHYESQP